MIKFFRKIRQKLLSENKLSKYLIYAVGEIVLVVIGILIALSLNNWNENRKLKVDELYTLIELREDLKINLNDLEDNISGFERAIYSNEIIKHNINNHLPYSDSLDNHFASLYPYVTFSMKQSTFENLKATSVLLISNDSLRSSITTLYEYEFFGYKRFEDSFLVEHHDNYIKPFWMSSFLTFNRNYANGSETFHAKPINYDVLITDPKFLQVVNYSIDLYTTFARMQRELANLTETLITHVEREINMLIDEIDT